MSPHPSKCPQWGEVRGHLANAHTERHGAEFGLKQSQRTDAICALFTESIDAKVANLRSLLDRSMAVLDALGQKPCIHAGDVWPRSLIDESDAIHAEIEKLK